MDEPIKNKSEKIAPADDQEMKLAEVSKAEAEKPQDVSDEVSIADSQPQPSVVPTQTEVSQTVVRPIDTEVQKTSSSAGIIILQWLTYAFWGWTILSLVWLIFIVVASVITSMDTSDMVPYDIADAIVLLTISLVCDIFYGKHEPVKKTGASMVVRVIHAVIFALFGIGMLITGVLTVVQLAIGTSSDTDFQTVWIITAFMSAAIYALTFLRTLNPLPKLRLAKLFPVVMAVIVGVFIVAGFVGPVAQAGITKDDRVIDATINDVSRAVEKYTDTNNKLPAELADIDLDGDAKTAVDRGLYVYKPESSNVPVIQSYKLDDPESDSSTSDQKQKFRYQLCVTYKKADKDSGYSSYGSNNDYSTYPYTSGHPAGEVCYKLETSSYALYN